MEKFSDEITYTPTVSNHSSYVMRNVAPQGSNSLTLSAAGVAGPVEFILPPSVFNLSKSRLEFTFVAPASKASYFNFVNGNLLTAINRIVLYSSATNAVLCDVSSFNLFTSATLPASTKLDNFLTKPFLNGVGTTDATARERTIEEIQKCNISTANINGNAVDIAPYSPITQRRQWIISATATATGIDVSIPLESIKHTILSLDKNLYFPENMVCQIYFNPYDSYSFEADDVNLLTPLTLEVSSATTISNLNIKLAQENNLAIVSQTIDRVMRGPGISLPFSYPNIVRTSLATTSPSWQLSLTKAYGQRILGIITSAFSQVALTGVNWHYRNTAEYTEFLTQYNTFINSVAIKSQAGFDTTKSQDYISNRPYIDGSLIQSSGEYANAEWIHFDSFVGEKPLYNLDKDQTDLDGMDVSNASSTWQFQGTTTGTTGITYLNVILGQKILNITSSGAMVM
jgi:hypothetical protein